MQGMTIGECTCHTGPEVRFMLAISSSKCPLNCSFSFRELWNFLFCTRCLMLRLLLSLEALHWIICWTTISRCCLILNKILPTSRRIFSLIKQPRIPARKNCLEEARRSARQTKVLVTENDPHLEVFG